MKKHVVAILCFVFVLTVPLLAGEMTRGLTVTGGPNALAKLTLERRDDSAHDTGILIVRVAISQVRDIKGYGFLLEYDEGKYEFVEATELGRNLLKTGSDQETLFMASNRTQGKLEVGAMKFDGNGASGEGNLLDLVFKTSVTPSAEDFRVSESVLVGLDGAIEPLTHVEIGDMKPLPDAYGLDRNAPNPFNPSTVIGYRLPDAGWVRLVVYNILGQEVRVLVNERMEAGFFKATWDGSDERGRQVASGVYLYRIQAGSYSAIQRMLLLK